MQFCCVFVDFFVNVILEVGIFVNKGFMGRVGVECGSGQFFIILGFIVLGDGIGIISCFYVEGF